MAEVAGTALAFAFLLIPFLVVEGWAVSSFPWWGGARSDPYLLVLNSCVLSALALLLIGRVARRAGYAFALFASLPAAFADLRRAFRAYLLFFPALTLLQAVSYGVNRSLGIRTLLHPLVGPLLQGGDASGSALLVLVGVVLGPLSEEFAFRGFLYPALRRRLSAAVSIPLSAVVFALLHRQPGSWLAIAGLGALLAWSYERTGRLSVPIFIHAIHNALSLAVVLLLASAR